MKNHLKYALVVAVLASELCAQAQTPPNNTNTANVFAESTVQYVAGTAPTSFTNSVSGYNKVKWSATAPAKSYFKFDFTGLNVNTNYALRLTLPDANNNSAQHLQLWALNQSYATFTNNPNAANPSYGSPTLSWSNAQANATGITNNDLLTTGLKTATLIKDFMDTGGGVGTSQGVTLPAPWGQYLFNNQVVLVLTGTNDVLNAANGARFALASANVTYQPLTLGTLPPSISSIPDMTVQSTTSSTNIAFTVSDPVDASASLTNITLSLGNTNVTLITTNFSVLSGGNRTLTFTPVSNLAPGATANVTVTVIVTDSYGNSATSSFYLTVTPFVSLPVVWSGTNYNYLPPTNRVGAGSVSIPFQVVDTNIAASSLVVTGFVSAYSTNLGSLSFSSVTGIAPNTNNCTMTINATGSGVGIVYLTIIDPINFVTNTIKQAVMVLPDSSYLAFDLMKYQPSSSYSGTKANLFDVSGNLWAARTTSGSVNLISSISPNPNTWSLPVGVPLIRGTSSGNQNQLRLVGGALTPGSHKVIYASVYAQWADTSVNGTTAYYPGTSAGGFVEFAESGSASGLAMSAVCTVSNANNTVNTDGEFYLGLYNSTNAPSINTNLSQTIPNLNTSGVVPNSPVNVVISYDLDTGVSQLWLNQPNSAGTSVSLQDVAVTNLVNVNYIVLRQNANMGNILVSSVAVKAVTKPVPTITGVIYAVGTVTISYTDAAGAGQSANQQVWSSSAVDGSFAEVSSGVTINDLGSGNYSAVITGQTGATAFYKIKETGTAPVVTFPF